MTASQRQRNSRFNSNPIYRKVNLPGRPVRKFRSFYIFLRPGSHEKKQVNAPKRFPAVIVAIGDLDSPELFMLWFIRTFRKLRRPCFHQLFSSVIPVERDDRVPLFLLQTQLIVNLFANIVKAQFTFKWNDNIKNQIGMRRTADHAEIMEA